MRQTQTIIAGDILRAHCKRGEENMALYERGWNDERVLQELLANNPEPGHIIGGQAIQKLRFKLMGRLQAPAKPKPEPEPEPKIKEHQLAELRDRCSAQIEMLESRVTRRLDDMQRQTAERYNVMLNENDRRYTNWSDHVARRDGSTLGRVQAMEMAWAHALEWLKRKGYTPPPGRPQSSPPDGEIKT